MNMEDFWAATRVDLSVPDENGPLQFPAGTGSAPKVNTSGGLTFGGAIDSVTTGIGGLIEGVTVPIFGDSAQSASKAPRPVPRPTPATQGDVTPANIDGGAGMLDILKSGGAWVLDNIGAMGDFGGGSGDGSNRGNDTAAQRVVYGANAQRGLTTAHVLMLAAGGAAIYWIARN